MWSPMPKNSKNQFMILLVVLDFLCIMYDCPGDLNVLLYHTI